MRVLIVEDHRELAETLAAGLGREGMAVDVVLRGEKALYLASYTAYDVVVLDRDLPGLHGDQVCRSLAADGHPARILMLTAAGTIAAITSTACSPAPPRRWPGRSGSRWCSAG